MLFYVDQAKLETVPTRRRTWRPRGPHQPLPHSGSQKRAFLHAALSYPEGQLHFQVLPGMDTHSVRAFFKGLLANFPDRQLVVILDNAPAHTSHPFKAFVAKEQRLAIVYQPTYAPWTNPVERFWQEMRKAVTHLHPFRDLASLKAAAQRWCRQQTKRPDRLRQLASFACQNRTNKL